MPLWEYCEVGWTPKQVTIHVYSGRADGSYEGAMPPNERGSLLAQLGVDGWELVGVVPTKPAKANQTLYYFKRTIDPPEVVELEKQERLKAEQEWVKTLQEWEKAPLGAPLRLHHATIFKSTSPTMEPTEELTSQQSKTVMNIQENLDQKSTAASSPPEPQQEP